MAIRKIDPKATFKIISQFDDALINETPDGLAALKLAGKQTRYEDYLEDLDESKLLLDEKLKPSRFVVRCLKNQEIADINERFTKVDVVGKKVDMVRTNAMFLETFQTGCLGVEDENGKVEKVDAEEIGFAVAVAMGSVISLFTSLGKHLKKQ